MHLNAGNKGVIDMFGRKQQQKEPVEDVQELARRVTMIRFLDSNVCGDEIVYSFVMTYKDGHCEILEAPWDDELLTALMPKLM